MGVRFRLTDAALAFMAEVHSSDISSGLMSFMQALHARLAMMSTHYCTDGPCQSWVLRRNKADKVYPGYPGNMGSPRG